MSHARHDVRAGDGWRARQIAGTKTFRIYDPQQTAHLYAYPIHHPLDTRAQVDLVHPDHDAYPRLASASGVTITLHPGQVLFLPAYWWHEVLTEPQEQPPPAARHSGGPPPLLAAATNGGQPLTVSVNFWFMATNRILHPTRPLVPSMQCELARQLEYLISDCLQDKAHYVPHFFRALHRALEAARGAGGLRDGEPAADSRHAVLAERPADVPPADWLGLFGFVVWKLSLHLGPACLDAFVRELCHPSRFAALRLKR